MVQKHSSRSSGEEYFVKEDGIHVPTRPLSHRDEEYDSSGFETLLRMQRRHFWYCGRHLFLLKVLAREVAKLGSGRKDLRAIDLGGGTGGWLEYLHEQAPNLLQELALGDSSLDALKLAEPVVGGFARRYQVDLLDLPWEQEWDVVFLLDVLEHLPDDALAVRQVKKCLRPGGLLVATTPALNSFWSYNDELAHHQRRYDRNDYRRLAQRTEMNLLRTEYFMFFLSPLLFCSRVFGRPPGSATAEQLKAHMERTHRVPAAPVNGLLKAVFSSEAFLANRCPLPWGTSILAVFRK